MKKKVIGAIAGALLLTSVTVFADSASLVGKKVQGLFTVEQNGKKVADAVIIDGVAYAPVRAVSEAAGVELKVEGKKIIMSESETTIAEPVSTAIPEPTATPAAIKDDEAIKRKLITLEVEYQSLSTSIVLMRLQEKNNPNDAANNQKLKEAQAKYDEVKAEYDKLKAESGL